MLGATLPAEATRQEDLKALRARIEALARELEQQESSRREVRDALRDSERAISELNRTIAALEAESRELRAEAATIAERRSRLERSLAERQAALGRTLAARHAAGVPDALRVVLSGDDPAAVARTLHYAGYLTRASAALLQDYRAGLDEAARLGKEAAARQARLAELEQARRAERERIAAQRRERRQVLERIAHEMRESRRQIKVLRADEARLARLVAGLGRVLGVRVERTPQAQARKAPFSGLRGRLSLPIKGELIGRFGAPSGAGGAEAKGVFIRADEGAPVRAIADGQVVYADWMRGFGNLMIVDHGEAYLSIYANNESLLKQVGEGVAAGETIATTGMSGGREHPGLYFELRHLGRAVDPLGWVKLK